MNLAELQSKFQAGILGDDQSILASIPHSHKTNSATLFAVYHNAYRFRLAEILSNDFPMLLTYLSDETFGQLVEEYILSAPSKHRDARWYGARLPDFMRETETWRANRGAQALAQFERALSDAFDAADASACSISVLAELRADDWPNVVFEFHPSFTLLDLAKGATQIYADLANDAAAPEFQHGEEAVIFWRAGGQSVHRVVADDERLALTEARQGKTFSDICALLAVQKDNGDVTQRVAGFLAQWFADELIIRAAPRG
jgi:hypothetical protein